MEIKKIRILSDKTQKEVAEAINIAQNTYSNYETGKTQPDYDTLIRLADYFKTTTDNLLGHEVPYLLDKSILTEEQKSLIDKITQLSKENCQRVEAYITGLLSAEEEKQIIINKYKRS